MSTTFDAPNGDAPTPASSGLALADEDALHRTFLAEYPALAEEARASLGEEARVLAPKVVEGSFVRAWDARARFRTPQEVHQFLVEDVHHAAARALSRRAGARRLAGHEHANPHAMRDPSLEESWAHVQHALHSESHSPQALAAVANHARHDAAEHITRISRPAPPWVPIGIGVAVLAGLIGLAMWMNHMSTDARYAQALGAPDARVVTSASAQVSVVTLDDGSRVRLAPESRLVIAKGYGPDTRAVRLLGTGSFEVASGFERKFQVLAGDVAIVARGTAFTVRANQGDPNVTVVVTDDSVEIGQSEQMKPFAEGSAVVASGTTTRAATAAEREEADGWRTGTLAITDRPLGEVLPLLKRWYGLAISVPHAPLLERRVTLRASVDSMRQAIQGVEQSTGLRFGYVGPNMVFREPEKAAAKPAARTKRTR